MVSCSHGISLLVFNSVSHLFATLTGEILSRTMEEKFHVPMCPCIILYLSHLLSTTVFGVDSYRQTLASLKFHRVEATH